jgi:hypothetical protein
MPQCAVIGCPGHTGQLSPAALSQTVKTKSITGASGTANSCQILKAPSAGYQAPEHLEGEWIDLSFGLAAGGKGPEAALAVLAQDRLRQD